MTRLLHTATGCVVVALVLASFTILIAAMPRLACPKGSYSVVIGGSWVMGTGCRR